MSDIDQSSIVISKVIQNMEDFHSILKLVEEKLQESSNFLFLLLENVEKNENPDDDELTLSKLDVKLEEDIDYEDKEEASFSQMKDETDSPRDHRTDTIAASSDSEHTGDDKNDDPDFKWNYKNVWKNNKSDTNNKDDPVNILISKKVKKEKKLKKVLKVKKIKKMKKTKEEIAEERKKKGWGHVSGVCEECGKWYAKLNAHVRGVHEKKERSYTCPYCNLEMNVVYYAKFFAHKQKCEAEFTGVKDRYVCKLCGHTAPTLQALHSHNICVHKQKIQKPYIPHIQCTYENCTYKTNHKFRLQNHINTEHLNLPIEKYFSCETCGKSYTTKSALRGHVNAVHLNLRNHVCSDCGSSFSDSTLLKNHRRIHSDILAYQCPYCSKGFKQSAVLYRHKISCHMNPNK